MIAVGIDISTKITGYTFIKDDTVIDVGYIDLRKLDTTNKGFENLFEKGNVVTDSLLIKLKEHNVTATDKIIIEAPMGMATGSNINSAIMLNRFNYMIAYFLFRNNFVVTYITSQHARKLFLKDEFNNFNKFIAKGDSKKEFIVSRVKPFIKHLIEFEMRPRATEKHKEYFYDICDSFVIAKSFFLE